MKNIKLLDLKKRSLHSTENYMNALKHMINVHEEMKNYLKTQILVILIDYPGQPNIWHASTHYINIRNSSKILKQILHIVLIIGPLHIFLNSHKIVFLLNYQIFNKLFHEMFEHQKVLAKKLKPYKINLLLELAFQG